MRIVHVGPKHPLCKEFAEDQPLGLPWSGKKLLENCQSADGAIIAREDGVIVGFFRYFFDKFEGPQYMGATGTWVHPKFRSRGLAKAMWSRALKVTGCREVGVNTISRGGRRLVAALKVMYPDVKFGDLR